MEYITSRERAAEIKSRAESMTDTEKEMAKQIIMLFSQNSITVGSAKFILSNCNDLVELKSRIV